MAVHLLGPLYAAIDDVALEDWPSARCRSLFGYLLTHREPRPQREVLMEAFWPGSSPEASRNSLNVAMHALRRTLRAITETPVVVYGGGAYRINRDLRLWLDVDEFDSRVKSGRRFEDAGEIDKATRDYEFAGGLYRGPIDGNMSASLHASIKDFQQIVGLPQTGNLDAETAARLSNSSAVGGSASNGNTSTSGNLGAIQPFSPTPTVVVPNGNSTPAGATIFATPFQLSQPINTSNATPPGVFIQP